MADKISDQQVREVANLARLDLDDEQLANMAKDLGSILEYVEQLDAVDTEGVEPLSHPLSISNVLREDTVTPSLAPDEALANAPQRHETYFKVPKVLDQGQA